MAALNDYEEWRTLEVFRFVQAYIEAKGISPTLDEIADDALMSKGNIPIYLGRLEGWAWIERQYRIPRSIRLGEKAPTKEALEKLIEQKKPKDSD